MTDFIVHGIPGSPYVRAALLALEEKGAEYELAAMQFGTLKQQPHLSRHPFGRIPAFEHDGWMLYETQAIMRYVDEAFPAAPLQPIEVQPFARMNQIMGIVDNYLTPCLLADVIFQRMVAPMIGRTTNDETVSAALPKASPPEASVAGASSARSWIERLIPTFSSPVAV